MAETTMIPLGDGETPRQPEDAAALAPARLALVAEGAVVGLVEGLVGAADRLVAVPSELAHLPARSLALRRGRIVEASGGADPVEDEASERRQRARAACARRIEAVASAAAQANMTAYAALLGAKPAETRSPEERADLAAFAAAVGWVGAMRARWREIADQGLDPAVDSHWPPIDPAAAALARRF